MKFIKIGFAAVLSLSFFVSEAYPEQVVIKVKGMVCSFCAQGIKRTFEKNSDVKKVDVDLDNKLVTVDFAKGKAPGDKELAQIIMDAGYDVVEISKESDGD